jgi:sugar phosphate isomerase/epimerase
MNQKSPSSAGRRSVLAGAASLLMLSHLGGAIAANTTTVTRRVLWAANVRTKSFEERLLAAQLGGFTHMSVFPIDWRGWTQSGLTGAAIRARLRATGIKVLAVDPFVQWVPDFAIPSAYPKDYRGFIDFSEQDILMIAQELEAEAINCVEGLGQSYPQAVLIERFGAFADRAKQRGLRVTLEFMPISSIAGLQDAWPIVAGANRSNAGLCFDTWHYFRSTPDEALLRTIPGEKIFEVQLADALKALQGTNLTEDLLRFRRLPGEGELDIAGVSKILKSIGAWRSVGPEVFADAMDALAVEEVGKRCGNNLQRWL